MKTLYKKVDSVNEFVDAIRIRVDVFIIEQKCLPGWEPDDEDKISEHYVAIVDGEIVATVRFREIKKNEYKIERMAIKKEFRKKGIGKDLLFYVISQINKLKPEKIWIQSQFQAKDFYQKCGFQTVSKPYDLWGIQHIDMKYKNK